MKKSNRRAWKQCNLEPVEREPPPKLPGVPVHFNYGIFFDDDYDYMQHLKEASEFNGKMAYKITCIPEDEVVETVEEPVEERPREPEADARDMVVEGLGLDSDTEIEADSDLEDNFVELAGGHAVEDRDTDEEVNVSGQPKHPNPHEMLSREKVLMMERFLYGDNERDSDDEEGSSEGSDDEDMDETAMGNRQFEKLLQRCKNRAGSASQSMVTGTSMMSEGLQHALKQDTRILEHKHVRSDDLDDLTTDMKEKTLASAKEVLAKTAAESSDDGTDDEDSEAEEPQPTIFTIQDETNGPATKPNFTMLSVPVNPKSRSRQVSMESLHTVGQAPVVATMRATEVDSDVLVRRRGETAEEKHRRKLAVKQHRQERRRVRKANQANFRAEQERQMKNQLKTLTIS